MSHNVSQGQRGSVRVLNEVEMLERLAAMWKSGALSDAEFQQQKAELLSGLTAAPASAPYREEKTFWQSWGLWVLGGAIALGLLAILLLPRSSSGSELPSELVPAREFQRDGEPWSAVEKVPAEFRGSYGPSGCSIGSQELTDTQQIMHWTGDPPKVLRTFKGIYVSGDRLLVDGSPDAITVYEKSPAGSLVMLRNWSKDPKLPAQIGPNANPACPAGKSNGAEDQEA